MSERHQGTEIALAIRVEQFEADHLTCDFCDKVACAFVSTGADPERVPFCGSHTAQILEVNAHVFRLIGGEAVSPLSETAV